MPISIHALVKRATFKRSDDVKSFTISIHALVKRATVAINPDTAGDFDFNPRPREKGDSRKWLDVVATACFNPRPREKGDVTTGMTLCYLLNFNPRPREKGDSKFIQ